MPLFALVYCFLYVGISDKISVDCIKWFYFRFAFYNSITDKHYLMLIRLYLYKGWSLTFYLLIVVPSGKIDKAKTLIVILIGTKTLRKIKIFHEWLFVFNLNFAFSVSILINCNFIFLGFVICYLCVYCTFYYLYQFIF